MNNLHRELAPISDAAWAQIEEETARTFKRYLAGRRVVDVRGPAGADLSAVGTGHLRSIAAQRDGILARQRDLQARGRLGTSPAHHSRSHRLGGVVACRAAYRR